MDIFRYGPVRIQRTWVGAGIAGGAAIGAGASLLNKGSGQKALPTLDPNQQPVSSDLSAYFQSLNPSSFAYGGQLTAPITSGQSDVVAQNAAFSPQAYQTFSNIGTYNPDQINKEFNDNIENPTMSNYVNNVLPYIRESIPGFSSEQGTTTAHALETEQNSLDAQRLGYQQQGQVNAMNAIQGANQYAQGSAQIQSIPQQIQQAGLSNAYTQFLNSNQSYQKAVDQMLGYLNIETQAYTPTNNTAQQLISGAGAGAQIGSSIAGVNSLNNINSNLVANNNANQYSLSALNAGTNSNGGPYNPYNPGGLNITTGGY